MDPIQVSRPDEDTLQQLGVRQWAVWEKEASTFDWTYDEREVCFLLEGQVRVEPTGDGAGEAVEFGPGDMVIFPQGLSCVWAISVPVRKHYRFG